MTDEVAFERDGVVGARTVGKASDPCLDVIQTLTNKESHLAVGIDEPLEDLKTVDGGIARVLIDQQLDLNVYVPPSVLVAARSQS